MARSRVRKKSDPVSLSRELTALGQDSNVLERCLGNQAPLFAALGDRTRLALLVKIGRGEPQSVTNLARDSKLTRQAIRKHLQVLEDAGMVRGVRRGRENLFEYDPGPVEQLRLSLDSISQQWNDALNRLKKFVEE